MAFNPGNLPLSTLIKVIEHEGCKLLKNSKGHLKYSRQDLLRPIVIQNHIDPVPMFIVKQIMRTLSLSSKDMDKILTEI